MGAYYYLGFAALGAIHLGLLIHQSYEDDREFKYLEASQNRAWASDAYYKAKESGNVIKMHKFKNEMDYWESQQNKYYD